MPESHVFRVFCTQFPKWSSQKLITFILFNILQLDIGKQFIGRAITLIVWPILLYMCFFYIHLEVLNHSGSGDGFFSTAFQSQLIGNSLHNATMPRQVAYGAVVTFKNHKTGGGYLHSHSHLYPKGVGIRQQQVNWSAQIYWRFCGLATNAQQYLLRGFVGWLSMGVKDFVPNERNSVARHIFHR